MDDVRIKEATNELASLNSSLNLGSEKCLLKNMCNWHERKFLMPSTTWLSWHGGREIHLGLDLIEEPMEGNDDD